MWRRLLDLLRATRRPLVVLDFETAGLGGAPPVEYAIAYWAPWADDDHSPATVAARRHAPPGLTYAATARLSPGRPIDPGARRVHGISDDDVRGALPYRDMELTATFRALAAGDPEADGGAEGPAVWCGHNAAESDVPWAQRWGYLPTDPGPVALDTMRLQRRLRDSHPMPLHPDVVGEGMADRMWRQGGRCPVVGHGLLPYATSLVGLHTALYGDPPEQSHGAMADALSTARCLGAMLELWAPLWPGSVVGEDLHAALDAMIAALAAPPPGAVSWDGWLQEDRDTGALTWSGKAKKIGGEGTPLVADRGFADFVMKLPPAPTGVDGKAWCSDVTREALRDALAGRARPARERVGEVVDLTP